MAGIIDSLVIELGFDTSKLKSGSREAKDEVRGLKDSVTQDGKEIEGGAKKTADSFESIKKGLLGLAAGYLSFTAIKDFIHDVVQQNIALNNTAAALGTSIEKLSSFRTAAALAGGSAAGITQTIKSLTQELTNYAVGAPSQGFLAAGAALGIPLGNIRGPNGQVVDYATFLKWTQQAAQQKLREGTSPAVVSNYLGRLGITDEGTVAMLMQRSPEELNKFLEEARKLTPTSKDIDAVKNFNTEWQRLMAGVQKLGDDLAPVLNNLVPFVAAIDKIVLFIDKMVLSNQTAPNKDPYWGAIERGEKPPESWGGKAWNWLKESIVPSAHGAEGPAAGAGAILGAVNAGGPLPARSKVASLTAQQLRDAGLPETGVAGVLGNIQQESGFNPTLRHPDQPKFSGEAHYAHGLYQEGGTEWNNYSDWLSKNYPGRSWTDPKLQTEFLVQNLQKNYPKVWQRLNDPNLSAEQKALAFQTGYLKPAAWAANSGGRMASARRFLEHPPEAPGATPDTWGAGTQPIPWLANPASTSMLHNQNSTTNNVSSAETHIGNVIVNTQATDAFGIAKELVPLLKSKNQMTLGNTGPQ